MVLNIQYLYLSVALFSCGCVMTNQYIIPCSNIIGTMCIFDFYFIKKKDMILHHILVLCMLHYMHHHSSIENGEKIAIVLLKTEISTIFLTTNNLLENTTSMFKNINRLFFISTFVYYRIYNYSYLILNKNLHSLFLIHSKPFYIYEIYIGIYGMFLLNLYWTGRIISILGEKYKKLQ